MSLSGNSSDFWNWLRKVLTTLLSYNGGCKHTNCAKTSKIPSIKFKRKILEFSNSENEYPEHYSQHLSMQWFPGIGTFSQFHPPQRNISVFKIKSCLVGWVQLMVKGASFHFNGFYIECKIWVCQPTRIFAIVYVFPLIIVMYLRRLCVQTITLNDDGANTALVWKFFSV